MSLFDTMKTGASGLGVASMSLAVIGDNIANVNTVGFKANRASFADLIPEGTSGLDGAMRLGNGAGTEDIAVLFGQGSLEVTTNSLDLAINGNGFFVVNAGADRNLYYTRAGEFQLDVDGYITTSDGMQLQGYNATGGVLETIPESLQIDLTPLAPSATTELTVSALLSTDTDYATTTLPTLTLDGTAAASTIEDAAAEADYTTSITIYDSLGQAHQLTVMFERTGANTWYYSAIVDGGEVGLTDGAAFSVANGTMTFDTDGNLTGLTQINTAGWTFDAATAGDYVFDFGLYVDPATGTAMDGEGDIRMQGTESALNSISQDGWTVGNLTEMVVDSEGVITGTYSNGEQMTLGQVAMASFDSLAGLVREGSSLFRATQESGDPAIGAPNTDGRGSITAYALEASNVDLEGELVAMIQAQRTYQANSRTISTANETLQELVQLV